MVVDALFEHGVEVVFGYPGGAILPVYDAWPDGSVRHVLCRHEQGAALAADGYARATGKTGVCIATSGPGATNLVTGLANALLDSIPIVALTGQVDTRALGTDAFQEVDTLGLTMPVVKHSFLVRKVADLPGVLCEAFRLAQSGRPGPVLVDLPKDVQLATLRGRVCCEPLPGEAVKPVATGIEPALELLRASFRPVVYAGGGVGMADAVGVFRSFVELGGIPTVTTLKGLGLLPPGHPLNLGMLGMFGLESANKAVQQADLLVVLGARFDDRVTGKLAGFAPHAKVLHIDIDAAELGKVRSADVAVVGHLLPALQQITERFEPPHAWESWRRKCAGLLTQHRWDYAPNHNLVYAPRFLRALSDAQMASLPVTWDNTRCGSPNIAACIDRRII